MLKKEKKTKFVNYTFERVKKNMNNNNNDKNNCCEQQLNMLDNNYLQINQIKVKSKRGRKRKILTEESPSLSKDYVVFTNTTTFNNDNNNEPSLKKKRGRRKKNFSSTFIDNDNININNSNNFKFNENFFSCYANGNNNMFNIDNNTDNNNNNNNNFFVHTKNKNEVKKEIEITDVFENNLPVNNEIEYFKIMENSCSSTEYDESMKMTTSVNKKSKYKMYNKNSLELCVNCHIPLLISIECDSLFCKKCKHRYKISDNTMATVSFMDEVELQIFPYQKPDHALKWKNNILWRSRKLINVKVLHYIMQNLKTHLNLTDVKDIECYHINYIVRKLKLNSLYQHTTQIYCRITGTPPPTIDKDVEENGDYMFLAIQEPFNLYKKPERKNLFSYPFIWYNIWQSLGQYHLLKYLFLLSDKKLKEQSEIWKKICSHHTLNWKYIPTEPKQYDFFNKINKN